MSKRCEYCGGSQRVHIYPMYREITAFDPSAPGPEMIQVEFPCPNCSDTAIEGKIRVLKVEGRYPLDPALHGDPRYLKHCRQSLARGLLDEMLNQNLVRFFETPSELDDQYRFTWEKVLRCRVGVVSPAVVGTLEERVSARQDEVIIEVAARAEELVSQTYGGDSIYKRIAVDTLAQAVQDVRKKRDSMKEIEDADRHPAPRNPRSA